MGAHTVATPQKALRSWSTKEVSRWTAALPVKGLAAVAAEVLADVDGTELSALSEEDLQAAGMKSKVRPAGQAAAGRRHIDEMQGFRRQGGRCSQPTPNRTRSPSHWLCMTDAVFCLSPRGAPLRRRCIARSWSGRGTRFSSAMPTARTKVPLRTRQPLPRQWAY